MAKIICTAIVILTVCNKQGIHVIIIIILKYIKNELHYNFAFCFVYIIYWNWRSLDGVTGGDEYELTGDDTEYHSDPVTKQTRQVCIIYIFSLIPPFNTKVFWLVIWRRDTQPTELLGAVRVPSLYITTTVHVIVNCFSWHSVYKLWDSLVINLLWLLITQHF